MCGICGTVGDADEARVRAMTDSIGHRGPDGDGIRCFPARGGRVPAALGHRRLSVIDPTPRGAQPMSYGDARYWITYNGELYNFRELRTELERDGFGFHTDCDTEVLLALYVRDGERMLDRMNGIFAFAIWDTERGQLFLARDRLGVKPLYYHVDGESLLFASEVKALLAGGVTPRLDPHAVPEFLTFLWVPDPQTLFDGVRQLPAGHWARFADGRLTVREYWDMTFAVDEQVEEEAWPELVRDTVNAAIRRQRVADVPLGSFLSGGIDSSAIVAELSRVAAPVSTYTVGFSQDDLRYEIVPDDVRWARTVGQLFGTDYHERTLSANIVELLPKLIWHMDEPVADPAAITTYLICREAREDLTVILSGMGGDEVFAGYPRHLAARYGRLADLLPQPARAALQSLIQQHVTVGGPGRLRAPRRNLMKFARGLGSSFLERYLVYCSYYTQGELNRLLAADLRAELGDHDPFSSHRAHLAKVRGEHWLNQLLYLDMKTFLPCLNLMYTDKMSMATSAEVRVPLLDDEVVGLSARIPPELKLRRRERKYVFKRSMEPVLPKQVIWRPKAGFGAPLRSWLVGELRPLVDELLSESAVVERGLLDPTEVRRIVTANQNGTEDNALRIWALVHLELWQQTFVDAPLAVAH